MAQVVEILDFCRQARANHTAHTLDPLCAGILTQKVEAQMGAAREGVKPCREDSQSGKCQEGTSESLWSGAQRLGSELLAIS